MKANKNLKIITENAFLWKQLTFFSFVIRVLTFTADNFVMLISA